MEETPKLGRPSKFNDALKEKMLSLYEKGKTDTEVADLIGVCEKTIHNWKGRHPDFLQALKESKSIADDLVEASLFRRATGYSHPETKFFCYEGEVITEGTVKYYPPDTAAATLWLKNRQPDQWREEKTVILEGGEKPIQIGSVDLSDRVKQIKGEE